MDKFFLGWISMYILLCAVFYYFNQNLIFLIFGLISVIFCIITEILTKYRYLKLVKSESTKLSDNFFKKERIDLITKISLNNIFSEFNTILNNIKTQFKEIFNEKFTNDTYIAISAAKISFDTQKTSNDVKTIFHELSIIKTGLNDESYIVKLAWASRTDFTPTHEQVERGLTDNERVIRKTWAQRLDWTPTPEQFERGVCDIDTDVVMAWLQRPNLKFSPSQIERGLQHPVREVREAWEQVVCCENNRENEQDATVLFPSL
ncbi:hypothetical protein [Desulfurella sp.]|uniref:hypothetical protein n=1 Tax=Desulfurella sp. TaxID=1962857 RepID=UPI0025C0807C|nr:hypothetical protein [Desulfurella sp.]